MSSFAFQHLKPQRLSKNLSLADMASKIGVSKTHLFKLESGKSRNPTLDIMKKLANGYEVSVELLMGESISHGDKNMHDKNW